MDASSAPLTISRRHLRWLLDGLSLKQQQAHPYRIMTLWGQERILSFFIEYL